MSQIEKYAVYHMGAGEWCVINSVDDFEVCVCNAYDNETSTPEARARMICAALNSGQAQS